jgi:hypothetical protein
MAKPEELNEEPVTSKQLSANLKRLAYTVQKYLDQMKYADL